MKLDLRDIQQACPELAPLLRLPTTPDRTTPYSTQRRAPDLPAKIGPHVVLEELGKGGMGIVYRVRFNGDPNHECALKTLQSLTPTVAQRHRHDIERFAQAAVKHLDGFVRILNVGQVGDRPFFVMELLRGGTLGDRIAAQGLETRAAAQLVLQLARSVHKLHTAGFVHRDLKPSNVMFEGDEPRISDFGLARQIEQEGPTNTGEIMGTPAYMSPEQARGVQVDCTTDVWSLGVILYELLAGQTPFRRATPAETCLFIANKPPLENLLPDQPRALREICIKCLRGEKEERYPTAQALAEDLQSYLDHGQLRQGVPLSWYVHNWLRLNPRLWRVALATTIATMLVVAAVISYLWMSYRAEQDKVQLEADKRREVEAAQQRTEQEKERAQRRLFGLQLREARDICHSEPDHTRALLNDEQSCPPRLRDFTWNMLHEAASRAGWTYELPDGPYSNVCFAPDGNSMAGINARGAATLWKIDHRERRLTEFGNLGAAKCLTFRGDGKRLAVGDTEGHIHLIDPATRKVIHTLPDSGSNPICIIRFSPDGQWVAASNERGKTFLWDGAGNKLVRQLDGPQIRPLSLAFSIDGQTLAVGTGHTLPLPGAPTVPLGAGEVRWWNLTTWKESRLPAKYRATGLLTEFQPRRPGVLTVSTLDGEIVGIDLASERETFRYQGSVRGLTSLAFSATGDELVFGGSADVDSRDGNPTGTISLALIPGPIRSLQGFQRDVHALALAGDSLLSMDAGSLVAVLDLRSTLETQTLTDHTNHVTAAAVSPDGRWLLTGSDDRTARLYDVGSSPAQLVRTLTLDDGVVQVAVARHADVLVAATGSGKVHVVNREGEALHTLELPSAPCGMALLPDGQTLITIGDGKAIALWDLKNGQKRVEMESKWPLRCLALSPDGKRLAVAEWDDEQEQGGIQHWRIDGSTLTREERWTVTGAEFTCLAFDAAGKTLAGGDLGKASDAQPIPGRIRIWAVDSSHPRASWEVSRGSVNALSFAPDGQTLVSASNWDSRNRGQLTFWDRFTWEERLSVRAHAEAITSLQFTPDSRMLISTSNDRRVALWGGRQKQ